MENEKYGIELEAKTNLFKKGLLEISNLVKKFGKEAEEETDSCRCWQRSSKHNFSTSNTRS